MKIPMRKSVFLVPFSVFFLNTIHDGQAFDNGDVLSIFSRSVEADQKIDPTSAFAGGIAVWGKRASSVVAAEEEFKKMNDFKSAISGSSAIVSGEAYDKIVDSRVYAVVKPICKIRFVGRGSCFALNIAAHSASFAAGDSLKETARSFANTSYDSVNQDINAAVSGVNAAIDNLKDVPLPRLNPNTSNDQRDNKQIGGIQTEKNNCISTNLNPELDDCFKDEQKREEETETVQQLWKSTTLGVSAYYEEEEDDFCFPAPTELNAFTQHRALEYQNEGCSVQMADSSGLFSYSCPKNTGLGHGTVTLTQKDKTILMTQRLVLNASNPPLEAVTLFEKCDKDQ